jgi:hypothetical protein
MTPNLRTATTEPPPPSGEFVSRDELLRRKRALIESASRDLARAADIDAVIENRWPE